jgi:hypothetical protein
MNGKENFIPTWLGSFGLNEGAFSKETERTTTFIFSWRLELTNRSQKSCEFCNQIPRGGFTKKGKIDQSSSGNGDILEPP